MSVFIVAEAGVNHLGDRAKMLALCDAAKAAGADAVKFQAYSTDDLCARRGIDPATKDGNKTWALLSASELSDADLDAIAAHCKSIGLKWFASVFDPSQIERVLSRGACALKIGHAESDWLELIGACRDAQRRTTRGSQSATEAWTRELRVWISDGPEGNVKGTWEYPAVSPPGLSGIHHSSTKRGFSSHYTDYRIPAAAALRGAEYIEAHLMLDTRGKPETEFDEYGPNLEPEAAWSLSPNCFAAMVKLIRTYEGWL